MYSRPIQQLIRSLSRLPSVGERTAERYVFHWLKSGKKEVQDVVSALTELMSTMRSCDMCFDFSDQSPCPICSNKKRDPKIICVVSEPQDIQIIEQTGIFTGLYHVLRGNISPDEEDTGNLKISALLNRIKSDVISEVILACNHDMAGETTMMYLEKKMKATRPALIVTRLARGLPMGSDLKYADEITLASAIKHRTQN